MKHEDLTDWQKGLRAMINRIKPSRSDAHSLNPQSSILNPFRGLKKIVRLLTHSIQPRTKLYFIMTQFWWNENRLIWPYLLFPFSLIFIACSVIRRLLYRLGVFRVYAFPVPIVVVGNLTVGGTGKTPLVIHLVQLLQEKGYHPGVVSRGYGVAPVKQPREVLLTDPAFEVGDEALVMKRHVDCPLAIGVERAEAVRFLLARYPECDVVVSDDGLQHYAMGRDIEILVIDGERRFGNGFCLPLGPLREPKCRARKINFVVCQGTPQQNEFSMRLLPNKIISLLDPNRYVERPALSRAVVHAVAGIGNPARFFCTLRAMGLRFFEHAFPDHYRFKPEDIDFGENAMVIMTEKDAVKCLSFANNQCWYLRVFVEMDSQFEGSFMNALLRSKQKRGEKK